MSKEAADRYSGTYQHWDMVACGWKYNMDNIQAALLIPQLEKIEDELKKRHLLYHLYIEKILKIQNIAMPELVSNAKSAYHLFTVWVDENKRDAILKEMGRVGIGVAVNYRAIHLLTYMKKTFNYFDK